MARRLLAACSPSGEGWHEDPSAREESPSGSPFPPGGGNEAGRYVPLVCVAGKRETERDSFPRNRQNGLTLVEMMVALVISLLLLAGLVAVFASMRSSFATTKRLNHLVSQERLASILISDTLANAGFYPLTNRTVLGRYRTSYSAFPATSVNAASTTLAFSAGQLIYGTGATAPGSRDVVATRMLTAGGGTVFDCQGDTNGSGNIERWINVLSVDAAKNQLMCTVVTDDGTRIKASTVPLIGGDRLPVPDKKYGGVNSLVAVYGVDTDADGSVDRYLSAPALDGTAVCPDVLTGVGNGGSCWPYVRSVRVTLGFVSAVEPDQTLYLTRNVVLDNAIGRNVRPGGGLTVTPPASTGAN